MEFFRPVPKSVLALMEASGARIEPFQPEDSLKMVASGFPISQVNGCYWADRDLISISKNPFRKIDITILHELIHWTGHPTRLNRGLIATFLSNCSYTQNDVHLEEAIAEFGSIILSDRFGLDNEWDKAQFERYKNYFKHHTILFIEHQARQACEYLIHLMESRKVA